MEFKHLVLPLQVTRAATKTMYAIVRDSAGVSVCEIEINKYISPMEEKKMAAEETQLANLFAAAPDLLAALEGIIEIGKRNMENSKYDGYFDAARSAIAKAYGKE